MGTWGYSWEIDDVEVFDTPENDIRIDNYISYTNYAQTGVYEYGAWPLSQIPDNLQAGAKAYNVGYADQSNVMLDLDVNGNNYVGYVVRRFGLRHQVVLIPLLCLTSPMGWVCRR